VKISLIGQDNLTRSLKDAVSKVVKDLADEVLVDARQNTPYKTGNARKNWNKQIGKENFAVTNKVPYIERLEAGASKQAPKGIIGPTLAQVKGKL
jgi:HK97 gp10 family phage protein